MALVPLTGVVSSMRTPGTFVEVVPGQGPSTASGGQRDVVYVMPKTSAGTGTVNTLYQITRDQQAIDLAGIGSPIHRAVRLHLKANNGGKVWIVPYAATSGGGAAAATATITVVNTATGRGTIKLTLSGEAMEVLVSSGDVIGTIATNIAAAINSLQFLPYTAAAVAGVVTLTAKIAGTSQNGIHRIRCEITSGITTTVTASAATLGSGVEGSTTEVTNFAAALAILASVRKYYIGTSLFDSTNLGALVTHVATKSEPIVGLRSQGVAAFVGSGSAGATLAIARNSHYLQIKWQENSELEPASIVGNWLGIRQKFEAKDTAYNFDDAGLTADTKAFWFVPNQYDPNDWPTVLELADAISDGLSPISSSPAGSYVVMSLNTRSKNAAGTIDDFRATETHRISVCDELADVTVARDRNTFQNFKQKDDQRLANGKVNPNQVLGPRTLTPSRWKTFWQKIMREFEQQEKLQQVDTTNAGMYVGIDPSNTGRIEASADVRVIDHAHQRTIRIAEVSPG